MKIIRTLRIYGSVKLQTAPCPNCGREAFIFNNRLNCCGYKLDNAPWDILKVEIDTVGKRRKKPSAKDRKAILEHQGNCCFYCGDQFGSFRKLEGELCSVRLCWDHIIPFSYDGNNWEFVAACGECNAAKSNLHFHNLEEAQQYLQLKIHEKKTRVVA